MIKWIKHGAWVIAGAALLAGCAALDSDTGTTEIYSLSSTGGSARTRARALASGDNLEVSVEVDGAMEVSMHRSEINYEGMVTLPLVGDVKIGGLMLTQARDVIANAYKPYYVQPPVVMLELMDSDAINEWGFITVLGRVNEPGPVPLPSQKGINLSAAIQAAGGFATSAKTSDIRVSRTDELGLKTRVSVDFDEIGEGNAKADILLIDGDIVHVPERIF
jgi:polysaccharide export outer membrane protein